MLDSLIATLIWFLGYALDLLGIFLWYVFDHYLLALPKAILSLFAIYSVIYYGIAWYKNGLWWGWYYAAGLYWQNTKEIYPWLWRTSRRVYYHLKAIGATTLPEEVDRRPPREVVRWKTMPMKVRLRRAIALIIIGILMDRAVIHWDVLAPLLWR